ncbi:MAG: hypothetical protein ABH891_03900 [Candidatus Omnitrophota bacterium]
MKSVIFAAGFGAGLSRTIMLLGLSMLAGCGTLPVPTATELVSSAERSADINSVTLSPPEPLKIVLKCVASNLEENAGLKIAGVIAEEGELPYVFAAPEKSGGLLVICIKELDIDNSGAGMRLTLVLRVFDSSGGKIYTRSITGVSGADLPQNQPPNIEKALQVVTSDVLRQYAKDPALRPLIMKYKMGSLLKFI